MNVVLHHQKTMYPPNLLVEVWTDLCKKQLLPIKLIYALLMAAVYSLFPFLTVHLRSLGVTAAETALIYALLPIIAFLAPPVMGILADKLGHVKVIFIVTCILNIISADCLILVPPTRSGIPYQFPLTWSLPCPHQRKPSPQLLVQDFTEPCTLQTPHGANVTFTIGQCSKTCWSGIPNYENKACFQGRESIKRVCVSLRAYESDSNSMKFVGLRPTKQTQIGAIVVNTAFEYTAIEINGSKFDGLSCSSSSSDVQCSISCSGHLSSETLCQNIEQHNKSTFWIYLVVRSVWTLLSSSTYVLLEAIILQVTQTHQADYGHQKLLGAVAMCIFSPMTGALIDHTSVESKKPNYNVAFYVYSTCGILIVMIVPFFDMDFKMPTQTLCHEVKTLLSNVEFIIFVLMMFFMGSFWGYLEGFLFWFLQEMNATESLMGLTVTVGAMSGIPMLIFSGVILKKIGHINVFILAFFLYGVRFFGYSFVRNPYLCLPFESLEAFTNSLQSVAAVTYTAQLAPTSILASAQGIMTGMQYGIGKGAGSLVGGYLMAFVGSRTSFQVMGVACLVIGSIYLIISHMFLKRRNRRLKVEFANKGAKEDHHVIQAEVDHKYNQVQNSENAVQTEESESSIEYQESGKHKKAEERVNGTQNVAFEADIVHC